MTPEGKTQAKVADHAKKLGINYLRLAMRQGAAAGWADMLFFIPGGRPLLIEFKAPGQTPKPLQAYRLKQLKEAGYDIYVCDDAEAGKRRVDAAIVSAPFSHPPR